MAGRYVTLRNTDSNSFRIRRIVANEAQDSESCTVRPNRQLARGQTYYLSFVNCGAVTNLEIETDRGTTYVHW
jgi:hypothetical protein